MGKRKRNRNQRKKEEKAANSAINATEGESFKLLETLKNGTSNQKRMACSAVAHQSLIHPGKVASLGVTDILVKLITPTDLPLAVAACGALRNLTNDGNSAVCTGAIKANLVDILVAILSDATVLTAPPKHRDPLLTQSVATLTNLCQFDEGVATSFPASARVFEIMVNVRNGLLGIEAAHFLLVLSEENPTFCRQIVANEAAMSHMVSVLQVNNNKEISPQARAAIAGILVNINLCVGSLTEHYPAIFGVLSSNIEQNLVLTTENMVACLNQEKAKVDAAISAIPVVKNDKESENKVALIEEKWQQFADEQLFRWRQICLSVKQSLEIIANVCVTQEDAKNAEGVVQLVLKGDLMSKVSQQSQGQLPPEVMDVKNPNNPLIKLLTKSDIRDLASLIFQTTITAYACLSNLVMLLPGEAYRGGANVLLSLLYGRSQNLVQAASASDISTAQSEMIVQELEGVTAVLWHILRELENCEFSKDQLTLIISLVRGKSSHTNTNIRMQTVAILGIIGRSPPLFNMNFVIGSTLLEMLEDFVNGSPSMSLEVVAECINSVIDVYSEDDQHVKAINDIKLLDKLEQFLGIISQKINQSARSLDEMVLERIMEMCENLEQFIIYKRTH